MINKSDISQTVIKNDYCIGCGACEYINPEKYKIEISQYGMHKAKVNDESLVTDLISSKVCPFSNASKDESYLSDKLFDKNLDFDHRIGKFTNCYAGYVKEGKFREKGSSGGFGKWLLNELLNLGYVDYVIQVEPNTKKGQLFSYTVYVKGDDILSGSKSAYYPVTMTEALSFIKNNPGKYAITALPCFSKALRLLARQDEDLNERVKFVLGVICGHLKSTGFAESLSWQVGVKPDRLKEIEFRGKIEGKKANEKGIFAVDLNDNKSETVSSRSLLGGDWGHGFFKYKACDYCDDIVGETADISIGDAWLDDYMDDHKGANVLISRNNVIDNIISEGIESGRLFLKKIGKDDVIKSQAAGIRHRREGLSYRLYLKNKGNEWVPDKRVKPQRISKRKRRKIYELREKLREESHKYFLNAKMKDDINIFFNKIGPTLQEYEKAYMPEWKRTIKKIYNLSGVKKYYKNLKSFIK